MGNDEHSSILAIEAVLGFQLEALKLLMFCAEGNGQLALRSSADRPEAVPVRFLRSPVAEQCRAGRG